MMTGSFEIKEKFYLNGEPFQIISGGIHYFRILPFYWEDRLRKLKALGCNTVETYIPWNMHEPKKGEFDFYGEKWQGMLDVAAFVKLAQRLGLWVILRPSPYICAEWDFGGLPAWLLAEDGIRLRTGDERFLRHVREYYEKLIPLLVPLQIDHGGPVLMMQVENEYGSFGNDKAYLESLRDMMRELGVTVPLFSSDGPREDMLSNTAIEGVFPVANFGSRTKEAFSVLRKYNHGGPCMCGEFWIGWFDAWKDVHHTTDPEAAAAELTDMLALGSVNIYMFEGGTNFGFMNGANYGEKLTNDVTSYDYDALLTEDGQITEKYRRFEAVIRRCAEEKAAGRGASKEDGCAGKAACVEQIGCAGKAACAEQTICAESAGEGRTVPGMARKAWGRIAVSQKVGLFSALNSLAAPVESVCPQSMERLGQSYGYILYSTELRTVKELQSIRMYEAADRAIVFANGKRVLTAEDQELDRMHVLDGITGDNIRLDILVENLGRVNYGPMLNWQRKGIDGCVMINQCFSQHGWQQYCLPMDNLEKLDYEAGYEAGLPAFYRFVFEVEEPGDTFLDFAGWGKGFAVVNGFNLGRYWEEGPQRRLYLPGALLKKGENEIILFESEGRCMDHILLTDEPDLGRKAQ